MLHRRPIAIPALLLAATGALTSCGFDYPTDRVNQLGPGDNNRDAQVDALGIRILATADGTGRLIGTLVNNDNEEGASLDAVSSEDGSVTAELESVEVPPNGFVNLARDVEIPVSGEFAAGEVVPVILEFSTGETAEVNVPVVKHCFQYTEIPVPGGEGSATEETEAHTEDGAAAAGEEHAEDEGDATYNCADEAPEPPSAH